MSLLKSAIILVLTGEFDKYMGKEEKHLKPNQLNDPYRSNPQKLMLPCLKKLDEHKMNFYFCYSLSSWRKIRESIFRMIDPPGNVFIRQSSKVTLNFVDPLDDLENCKESTCQTIDDDEDTIINNRAINPNIEEEHEIDMEICDETTEGESVLNDKPMFNNYNDNNVVIDHSECNRNKDLNIPDRVDTHNTEYKRVKFREACNTIQRQPSVSTFMSTESILDDLESVEKIRINSIDMPTDHQFENLNIDTEEEFFGWRSLVGMCIAFWTR